ncbi:D-lactate dehydrogenase [cytochrome], mitochondrial-like [Populus nigra]|uniref:D-lactate dehydrogenase [cytochrome], mitochondrial-like n=1 Tax=Populus nigra TaxID=3691 RepID=UPI002B276E2A|nr:D-lactate dehydrogenase [cytochrome], mitochondrial-like [Populus nigra]
MGGKRRHCVCFRNAMLEAGPGATIGGMCASRCSGSIAVRYGTMRDDVISLKVVLPNGDVVKTASRARKSAAGLQCTISLKLRMQLTLLLTLCCLVYR